MLTLGISGHFDLVPALYHNYAHDAAACLVADGELVAAAEEERFNRIKKTNRFPAGAIRACLDVAGVRPHEVDAISYYFDHRFADLALANHHAVTPTQPIRYAREVIRGLLCDRFAWDLPEDRVLFTPHHLAHAWSSYGRSGMSDALVVVMDGRGELASGTVYRAEGGELTELRTYSIPQSLGILYQDAIGQVGYGFGDEYKVMGLAPYGDPATYRSLFRRLYTLHDDGDYTLTPSIPDINPTLWPFEDIGFRPRRAGEEPTGQHKDFAAGLQEALETLAMHVITHWARRTGATRLCFTGGVAHNSSLNGRILRSGLFEEVFVHPSSHDAGAAEGAAIVAARSLGRPHTPTRLRGASLGPSLGTADEVERRLAAWSGVVAVERPADIVATTAQLLAGGAVVGWAAGRSEFGPRALGNRSIIADPRPAANRDRINAMVKKREGFRPFAPAVTAEAANTYFDLTDTAADHGFMSFVVRVREPHRAGLGAVTHVDGTARVQVVHEDTNPRFHALITRFGALTGTPVLLNTSFNNNAEPIVQTVDDAVTTFLTTEIDVLVVENSLIRRRTPLPEALDDLILEFRPDTRLVKDWRPGTEPEGEIYLAYSAGPRAKVSAEVFELLSKADGTSPLNTWTPLTPAMRAELITLWQRRFFTLTPKDAA
ncbi:carbamoyltransferase family protein [Saccharothrix australiensis]|uniref:Beta-1,4-N-acetylglucosamine oligosaccharide 3-O-carbamoyltransferase NolO n=1 Tax=Saccharothrix australiensis TaxID=2072 RepID=A0A495VUV3_9PSEU|nr:carbamoyltransferase C-terminal domain-containing protein [Saccharothrix australiensis]RKT53201.1 beta-1,4-N-acetylglucosamine oligosaccharide 3-O-carbamoyltransferase NolO [Saccharothrix australiensis]